MSARPNAPEIFDRDVVAEGGYIYARGDRLSGRLATARWSELMLDLVNLENQTVVDIGCGDGHFTMRFYDLGHPRWMVAVDPARRAIASASAGRGDRQIEFLVGDGHQLPLPNDSVDVAILQAVLHHDVDPASTLREALRVAYSVVCLEPNGYSPLLKILEKVSGYHRMHDERSYTGRRLRMWVEAAGGQVATARLGVAVPMFCPDWAARLLKLAEPAIERMPLVNRLLCAVYVFRANRR
jgi:SAM-dependent methyltransferase